MADRPTNLSVDWGWLNWKSHAHCNLQSEGHKYAVKHVVQVFKLEHSQVFVKYMQSIWYNLQNRFEYYTCSRSSFTLMNTGILHIPNKAPNNYPGIIYSTLTFIEHIIQAVFECSHSGNYAIQTEHIWCPDCYIFGMHLACLVFLLTVGLIYFTCMRSNQVTMKDLHYIMHEGFWYLWKKKVRNKVSKGGKNVLSRVFHQMATA